ncbi:hypothetical protein MKW98_005691 [Papaver atlanticum]|uniref:Uncharacterized protein n=1 Tax=Papaver atlanticum TaxID=357466 RepID=A0AAD4SNV8_9MAGN|nr:hypothetical protein MKW98_005691 [Papaver atlanticum]
MSTSSYISFEVCAEVGVAKAGNLEDSGSLALDNCEHHRIEGMWCFIRSICSLFPSDNVRCFFLWVIIKPTPFYAENDLMSCQTVGHGGLSCVGYHI